MVMPPPPHHLIAPTILPHLLLSRERATSSSAHQLVVAITGRAEGYFRYNNAGGPKLKGEK